MIGAQDFESQKNYNEDKKNTRKKCRNMAKKIYYAQQEWQNDHYYLGVTDAGLAFVGSANQSIEELKNWYPQAQLEASEKKTAPYKEALISYLNQHSTTFACPIDIEGTPFQKEVWQALQEIHPCARTLLSEIAYFFANFVNSSCCKGFRVTVARLFSLFTAILKSPF